MDELPVYFFSIVGLATCGLGAFAVLAFFSVTFYRYLRLEMISHSKEIADAEKMAGITPGPKPGNGLVAMLKEERK